MNNSKIYKGYKIIFEPKFKGFKVNVSKNNSLESGQEFLSSNIDTAFKLSKEWINLELKK